MSLTYVTFFILKNMDDRFRNRGWWQHKCFVHLQRLDVKYTSHRAFEDGPDRGLRNVGKTQCDPKENIQDSEYGENLKSRMKHHAYKIFRNTYSWLPGEKKYIPVP
jgi:hypothetical protein